MNDLRNLLDLKRVLECLDLSDNYNCKYQEQNINTSFYMIDIIYFLLK